VRDKTQLTVFITRQLDLCTGCYRLTVCPSVSRWQCVNCLYTVYRTRYITKVTDHIKAYR